MEHCDRTELLGLLHTELFSYCISLSSGHSLLRVSQSMGDADAFRPESTVFKHVWLSLANVQQTLLMIEFEFPEAMGNATTKFLVDQLHEIEKELRTFMDEGTKAAA